MVIRKKAYESESEEDYNNAHDSQDEDQIDSEQEFDDEEEDGVEEDDEEESDEEDDEEEDDEEEERLSKAAQIAKMKRDLAHVSFEQLAEIKGKMGEKEMNQSAKDQKKKISKDQILKDLKGAVGKIKKPNKVKLSAEDMKRENKHKPMEISSKRAVGRFRTVVELQAEKRRDPRFDKLSGQFNQDLFEKSYSFINDYKKSEMEMLKERMKKEKDPEKLDQLKALLTKMVTTDKQAQEKKRKQALLKEHKKKEAELVKQGKKPYFLKNSEKRKLDLIDRYEKLGKKSVDRILEKRRKKNTTKDRKHLPFNKRRSAE